MQARPPGARTRSTVSKNVGSSGSPIASIISIDATFVNVPSTSRKSWRRISTRSARPASATLRAGELGLRGRERDAGHARAVLAGSGERERAPAAADLEHVVVRAELELVADHPQLAPLRVGERLAVALEHRARVRHRVVEEEREEVVAEVVVAADVPPRGEEPGAAVEARPRMREAAQVRVAGGAALGVSRQQLEQRRQVVGAPLAGLVRLAEPQPRPRREPAEEPRVVDRHAHDGARPEAEHVPVRQPDLERPAFDAGEHALERAGGEPLDDRQARGRLGGGERRRSRRAPSPSPARTPACGGTGRA